MAECTDCRVMQRGAGETATFYIEFCARHASVEALEREVAWLTKVRCEQPGVAQCAKQWESNHQLRALEEYGLVDEFNEGCDSIHGVVHALAWEREQNRALVEALKEYGMHFDSCRARDNAVDDRCTCGLSAALRLAGVEVSDGITD